MLSQFNGSGNQWRPAWLLLVFTMQGTAAFAASFDCNKARTYREITVCSQPALSTLDETLSKVYSDARRWAPSSDLLRQSQRAWLSTADECRDTGCLAGAYQTRIQQLQTYSAANSNETERTSAPEPSAQSAPAVSNSDDTERPAHDTSSLADLPVSGGQPVNSIITHPGARSELTSNSSLAGPRANDDTGARATTNPSPPNNQSNLQPRGWTKLTAVAIILISLAVLIPTMLKRVQGRKAIEIPASTPFSGDAVATNNRGSKTPPDNSVPAPISLVRPGNTMNGQNELLEIARTSWNPALMGAVSLPALERQPLIVFQQRVLDDSEATAADAAETLRERISGLLADSAPFSYLIEAGTSTAASCWLATGDDMWFWGESRAAATTVHLDTSIEAAISTLRDKIDLGGTGLSIYLHSLFVLSDTSASDIDLSSVQDAIPNMNGTVLFFDAVEGQLKFQSWWDGDRDSGYLGAVEDGGDTDAYILEASPGREYLSEAISQLTNVARKFMPKAANS